MDRLRLDEQYDELLSGYYSDDAEEGWDLGRLSPTDYIMGGNITRTATGFALQISVTKSADKMTVASYSGMFTFAELDNLSGVRRASLDLLEKIGVVPTERTRTELVGAAASNHVNAQTALAQGIVAQRGGTEVAALSYFFQAAAFDPSLLEAASRANVLTANISSGNIGADIRNDIMWRREWVAKLTETEEFYHRIIATVDPPYTLFYSTGIEWGAIDYQTETVNLGIPINLRARDVWFRSVQQAIQAVYGGLEATGRKHAWGLVWPREGVTNTSVFTSQKQYTISIVFELINEQNRVIGRQTIRMTPVFNFSLDSRNFLVSSDQGTFNIVNLSQIENYPQNTLSISRMNQIFINYPRNTFNTVNFNAVKVDDISDNITIRIVSVNGATLENVRFPIIALSDLKWQEYYEGDHNHLQIENGVVVGFSDRGDYNAKVRRQNSNRYRNLIIPADSWGEPSGITSIGGIFSAFRAQGIESIAIPDSVVFLKAMHLQLIISLV